MTTRPSSIWGYITTIAFCVIVSLGRCWSEAASGTDLKIAHAALAASMIPQTTKATILARIDKNPVAFLRDLDSVLAERRLDPMLFYRVDKAKALPEGYSPIDLSNLEGTGLSVSRAGHRLRKVTLKAMQSMNAAAIKVGVILLVSSSYRSYVYQDEVWNRTVAAEGEASTEASVARPGHSQHQLGTAIDFGSISDAFAETKAAHWLSANAPRFGFSLSYPRGATATTGYKWESWHYRYIGAAAAALETDYFSGMQQNLLLFMEKI